MAQTILDLILALGMCATAANLWQKSIINDAQNKRIDLLREEVNRLTVKLAFHTTGDEHDQST